MGSGYHGGFGSLFGSTADEVQRTGHVPLLGLRRERRKEASSPASEVHYVPKATATAASDRCNRGMDASAFTGSRSTDRR